MKGFVPTPAPLVDLMVDKLFAARPPARDSRVLDPGCGEGVFIDGVLRACRAHGWPVPRIVGVELDPVRARVARERFATVSQVTIAEDDFLEGARAPFDFIIGNPPYVSIAGLSSEERTRYRGRFLSARGRFDLYFLFFEQALRCLGDHGTLVFVTPEKYLYVETGAALRAVVGREYLSELHFVPEDAFPGRITYPVISTIRRASGVSARMTRVIDRHGASRAVRLDGGASWQSTILDGADGDAVGGTTLDDCCHRVSCGVATGADSVYILSEHELPAALRPFAHPLVVGRDLGDEGTLTVRRWLLAPYDSAGRLLPEAELGALGAYLSKAHIASRLRARYCARTKPWYAFHDSFPLADMRRPKLMCQDITSRPRFVVDARGDVLPGHSVYYIVPHKAEHIEPLVSWLNGSSVADWLRRHCQRAAHEHLRLQSHVLKRLPVPGHITDALGIGVGGASIKRVSA